MFEYWLHPARLVRTFAFFPERCHLPHTGSLPHGLLTKATFLLPCRYRTSLCSFGIECKRSICFFAHQPSELRTNDCIAQLQALERDLEASDPAFAAPANNAKWGGMASPQGPSPAEKRQQQQRQQQDAAQMRHLMNAQVRDVMW